MNMSAVPVDEQVATLMFGADFGDDRLGAAMANELRQRLSEAEAAGRPLRVYCGYDPSRPDLHLGHSITLRKLRQFQDFGHQAVFLVGTFTAQVGDASDKTATRQQLSLEQVLAAARTYAEQAFKILDRDRTIVAYNHEWLSTLSMVDVIQLASHFTVQQFLTRDNYRQRLEANSPIRLHEFLYALLQGYDAMHLGADVQIGASEQLFNILAGRKLQEAAGQLPCVCVTYSVLVGTDGKMRMSKSAGNTIGLAEAPDEQYGKVMSVSDETMLAWIKHVTRWPVEHIESQARKVRRGELHPMELKKALAWEIVSMYHGNIAADLAQSRFETVYQERRLPPNIPLFEIAGPTPLIDVLSRIAGIASRSDARRLIAGKAVTFDASIIAESGYVLRRDGVLQIGKHRFVRVSMRSPATTSG
jgi:tyrosyl-tRNA synthetase